MRWKKKSTWKSELFSGYGYRIKSHVGLAALNFRVIVPQYVSYSLMHFIDVTNIINCSGFTSSSNDMLFPHIVTNKRVPGLRWNTAGRHSPVYRRCDRSVLCLGDWLRNQGAQRCGYNTQSNFRTTWARVQPGTGGKPWMISNVKVARHILILGTRSASNFGLYKKDVRRLYRMLAEPRR